MRAMQGAYERGGNAAPVSLGESAGSIGGWGTYTSGCLQPPPPPVGKWVDTASMALAFSTMQVRGCGGTRPAGVNTQRPHLHERCGAFRWGQAAAGEGVARGRVLLVRRPRPTPLAGVWPCTGSGWTRVQSRARHHHSPGEPGRERHVRFAERFAAGEAGPHESCADVIPTASAAKVPTRTKRGAVPALATHAGR